MHNCPCWDWKFIEISSNVQTVFLPHLLLFLTMMKTGLIICGGMSWELESKSIFYLISEVLNIVLMQQLLTKTMTDHLSYLGMVGARKSDPAHDLFFKKKKDMPF